MCGRVSHSVRVLSFGVLLHVCRQRGGAGAAAAPASTPAGTPIREASAEAATGEAARTGGARGRGGRGRGEGSGDVEEEQGGSQTKGKAILISGISDKTMESNIQRLSNAKIEAVPEKCTHVHVILTFCFYVFFFLSVLIVFDKNPRTRLNLKDKPPNP
eukprot:Tamp_13721.p3 GENE.Tamp_13721~~Tamp_13721.p3  ORF type:complete len:159 (-),score=12.00 Tamp_13721:876-1352(-)